jgi:4-amino-4-deoxy-L-arabinose transferase-like glycosyltransferase
VKSQLVRAATSLLLIIAVALGLRLAYLRHETRIIPRQALEAVPFLYEPGDIAYSLATGGGFGSPFRVETGPTAWTTPLYPMLVAGVFEFFGTFTFQAFLAAVLLNISFSTLTCVPIFYAGKRVAGVGVGAAAAWLWAIFPNAIVIPFQWIWDTSLAGLFAATLLWATFAVADSPRFRDWYLYGVLWGAALMTNATLLAALPFMLGWMAFRRAMQRDARWLGRAVLAAGVVVLCCVPWTIRNARVFNAFIPLRSPLWLQLWLGNNGQYRDAFPGWLHPIDNVTERARYIRMGEVAYMQEKKRETIEWVSAHPARVLELSAQRVVGTWLGTPHPWRDFRRETSLLVRTVFVANFLASLGALAGLVRLVANRGMRRYFVPVAALPVLFPFAFYFSQALLRYRYPIDPIVMLLVALAAQGARQRLRRQSAPDAQAAMQPLDA